MSQEKDNTLISAMSETPASVIEALIAFFAVWSVLGLAGFHSYLAGTNQTTNEEVRRGCHPLTFTEEFEGKDAVRHALIAQHFHSISSTYFHSTI